MDAFLDLIEAELARLIEENSDLRDQVEQLDQQLRAVPVETGPQPSSLGPLRPMRPGPPPMREPALPDGDYNGQAAKVLGLAQEMADRTTSEAKAASPGSRSCHGRRSAGFRLGSWPR